MRRFGGNLCPSATVTRPRKLAPPSAIVTVKPETRSPDFSMIPSRAITRLAALAVVVCAAPIAIDLTYQPLAGGRGSIRYEPDGKFLSVKDPFASATPTLTLLIGEGETSGRGVCIWSLDEPGEPNRDGAPFSSTNCSDTRSSTTGLFAASVTRPVITAPRTSFRSISDTSSFAPRMMFWLEP